MIGENTEKYVRLRPMFEVMEDRTLHAFILSDKMTSYRLPFMKTGDPNNGELQKWPKYTSPNGEVFVFDDVCAVKNDPDREARKFLPSI